MSAPDAWIVNVPADSCTLPATGGFPMSTDFHGAGSVCAAVFDTPPIGRFAGENVRNRECGARWCTRARHLERVDAPQIRLCDYVDMTRLHGGGRDARRGRSGRAGPVACGRPRP